MMSRKYVLRSCRTGLVMVLWGVACVGLTGRAFAQEDAMYEMNVPKTTPATEAAYARGLALFKANCSFCHGDNAGGGNGGPDLMTSILVNHDENGNLIEPTVHNGRPDKGMPSFPNFTQAQSADIVSFLHQQIYKGRLRDRYSVGNVLVGNAATGKIYFQAHCAQCHSVTDDLKGVGKRFTPDQLQQEWLDPADRGNDEDLGPSKTVTVKDRGKSYSGKLMDIDQFNVAWIDSNGYHSLPLGNGVSAKVNDPLAAHEELLKQLTQTNMHDVTTYLETLK